MTTIADQQQPQAEPASRPLWKRPATWIAAGTAVLAGTGITLALTLGGSGPSGAAGVITRDGYTVTQTMTADQIRAAVAANTGGSAADSQMAASVVGGDAAAGVKGDQMEAAVELSPAGKSMVTAFLPMLQAAAPGDTVRVDGDYLVITGPAASFGQDPLSSLNG